MGGAIWLDESNNRHFIFSSSLGILKLKKHTSYPGTFALADGPRLVFGYGAPPDDILITKPRGDEEYFWRTEFLAGELNIITASVELRRDAYCTVPLFYKMNQTGLEVSSDLTDINIFGESNKAIDAAALGHLLLDPHIDNRTLFSRVQLLSERSSLSWTPSAQKLTLPDKQPANTTLHSAEVFNVRIEETLRKYFSIAAHATIAFEVSGGIDSSTLPLIAAKQGIKDILLGSMRFIENFGTTQKQKLDDLTKAVNGRLITTQISKQQDFPLARFFAGGYTPSPFYQYQEIYTEALSSLAGELQQQGVEVVYTGIGGDELFEHHTSGDKRETLEVPSYYENDALILRKNLIKTQSVKTLLANSAYFASQSRNKIYLDHDIWPVSPLSDYQLYQFTQNLDVAFRSNKNILRAYHEASGFPSSIYHPQQNEHFGRFFEDSVKENYAEVLKIVGAASRLEQLGIINWQRLRESFDDARWHEQRHTELFAIFRVISAEIILQSRPEATF